MCTNAALICVQDSTHSFSALACEHCGLRVEDRFHPFPGGTMVILDVLFAGGQLYEHQESLLCWCSQSIGIHLYCRLVLSPVEYFVAER